MGTRLLFMVKADAYGHGLCEVAQAVRCEVDAFGVATVEEGIKLKNCGIKKDVLALLCAERELEEGISKGLVIALSNEVQLAKIEELINIGKVKPSEVRLHISFDSGMHRLGFCEAKIEEVLNRLKSCGICVEGVYSHMRVRSQRQIAAFDRVSARINEYYPMAARHLASSHSLECKRLRYDMVRVGIAAYEGALSVTGEVVAARRVCKGEYVSYGSFKLACDTNTAVVFGGYADGAQRERPSCVYIRNRRCRVLGRVCMDMCVVDSGEFLPDIGEEAVLVDGRHMAEISRQRKSVDYTVMTCWHGRVERIYIDEKGGSEAGG